MHLLTSCAHHSLKLLLWKFFTGCAAASPDKSKYIRVCVCVLQWRVAASNCQIFSQSYFTRSSQIHNKMERRSSLTPACVRDISSFNISDEGNESSVAGSQRSPSVHVLCYSLTDLRSAPGIEAAAYRLLMMLHEIGQRVQPRQYERYTLIFFFLSGKKNN